MENPGYAFILDMRFALNYVNQRYVDLSVLRAGHYSGVYFLFQCLLCDQITEHRLRSSISSSLRRWTPCGGH